MVLKIWSKIEDFPDLCVEEKRKLHHKIQGEQMRTLLFELKKKAVAKIVF